MQAPGFLQDFAIVMLVAGVVTLLFQRLRQPVVLGYLLAGFIIGPFSPPFELVRDPATIRAMADLGVVILMFCLGLEFNLRKVQEVGKPALVVAVVEISVMLLIGYELGVLLGWPPAERVLLGILLALTSTTIVVKSLRDRGELDQPHGRLIAGVSLYDDLFVILVLVLLPGFARTGSLPAGEVGLLLLKLFVFLVAAVVAGLLALPRLIRFAARFQNDEMLLVLALGLGFGMALLAVELSFSAALGAFLMGGLLAATGESARLVRMLGPVRDMFSAMFFITIGMLIDPRQVSTHGGTILLLLAVYLPAKLLACTAGALIAGTTGREALRVGTGMAQIGEFAFVLAAIATSLGIASDALSPIIVSVAILNAVIRPYLVDQVDRLAGILRAVVPAPLRAGLSFYRAWLTSPHETGNRLHAARRIVRSVLWQIALNLALLVSVFILAALAARLLPSDLSPLPDRWGGIRAVSWVIALLAASPILIATLRKMQALAMMMAELTLSTPGRHRAVGRAVLTHTLFALGCGGLVLLLIAVSAPLLPPLKILIVGVIPVALVLYRYGHVMNRLYSRAKFAVLENWSRDPGDTGASLTPPLPGTEVETLELVLPEGAGLTLRSLDLRARCGATVLAIERDGRRMVNPAAGESLKSGDRLVVLGTPDQVVMARQCVSVAGGDTA